MQTSDLRTRTDHRWYVLAVLTLVYALNIADRYVVSTLLEPIRLDLQLSDSQVAFVTGVALALFYVTVGLPIATLSDRANRRRIISVSLAIWSGITALCGLTTNYLQFLLARFGVGIGEAGGTPPSTSLLSDCFTARQRPMVMTLYALGAPLGAWLGAEFAGAIAEQYSWRTAFIALGIPGIVVALLVHLTVKEPPRGRFDSRPEAEPGVGLFVAIRTVLARKAAFHVIAGGTVSTLWGWGLMWWTPAFLTRAHGMSVGETGATLGPMHLVAGTAATLITGWIVARSAADDARRITWMMAGVLLLVTAPSVYAYVTTSKSTAIAMLWIVVPTIYFSIGPTIGLLNNLVPAAMRAQAMAMLLFAANIANLIIAPQLVGFASDTLAKRLGSNAESLRWALVTLAFTGVWAAWHYYAAARTIREEQV
jgi:MFS family permease